MITDVRSIQRLVLLVLWAVLGPMVPVMRAQTMLYVEHHQKSYPVNKVRGGRAYVEVDGKSVVATGERCVLRKVEEYLPFFVAVEGMEVRTSETERAEGGENYNHLFMFSADFVSAYPLKDVFLVLEMKTGANGKELFFYEVGQLEPNRPMPCAITTRMGGSLGRVQYQLHLYSEGLEVLQSKLPGEASEAALDRMVAKRIAQVQQAGPVVFIAPEPEYPAELLRAGVKGEVEISLRIDRRGRVLDPEITKVSHPAFGAPALAAIRQWRFLPKVEKGYAVETKASVPLDFAPPEASAKSR